MTTLYSVIQTEKSKIDRKFPAPSPAFGKKGRKLCPGGSKAVGLGLLLQFKGKQGKLSLE